MHVHRTNHAAHFTVLPNRVLQDRSLSFGARGLLGHLLSQPDDNREDVRKLAQEHPEGRRAVSTAMNELKAAGYYFVVRGHSSDGRITTETHIFDTPQPHAPIAGPGEPKMQGTGDNPVKDQVKEPSLPPPPADEAEPDDGADDGAGSVTDAASAPPPTSAVALLHRLGETEPRLRLGVPEALRLAPLVQAWLADGATEGELRTALTTGLPRLMLSPAGLLKHRLVQKKPPARVPAQRPPAPSAPRRHECGECARPVLQPGICRSCAGLGTPLPPAEAIAATMRGVAAVRAALRGYAAPGPGTPAHPA